MNGIVKINDFILNDLLVMSYVTIVIWGAEYCPRPVDIASNNVSKLQICMNRRMSNKMLWFHMI